MPRLVVKSDYGILGRMMSRSSYPMRNPDSYQLMSEYAEFHDNRVDRLVFYLDANRRRLYKALHPLPCITPFNPEATFLIGVDARGMEPTAIRHAR